MKKIVAYVMCIIMTYLLAGCSENKSVSGLENFSIHMATMRTGWYLLPSEDFLEKYEYIEGDYYWELKEDGFLVNCRDSSFIWLRYSKENYDKAKKYTTDTISVAENDRFIYNGYSFFRNLKVEQEEKGVFPFWYTGVGYNDEKCILLFMGLFVTGNQEELAASIYESGNWEGFIKEFYPEYDFDA